jgi:hypothetical protein
VVSAAGAVAFKCDGGVVDEVLLEANVVGLSDDITATNRRSTDQLELPLCNCCAVLTVSEL